MTHQAGAAVHQCPPAVEWLCTRRSVTALQAGNACSANSLTQHPQVCHSEERSDVGISRSGLRFRRGLYVIRPCTARLPRRFAPRNDNSGAISILTPPCSGRQQCAGPGCPLPYNAAGSGAVSAGHPTADRQNSYSGRRACSVSRTVSASRGVYSSSPSGHSRTIDTLRRL